MSPLAILLEALAVLFLGWLLVKYCLRQQKVPRSEEGKIIHALGYSALTPFYDNVVRLTCREAAWKPKVVKLLDLGDEKDQAPSVLDIGCGTGTLAQLIKAAYPSARVFGLDADENVLKIAKSKQHDDGVNFDVGYSTKLPYPDKSFTVATSSLFFHHLTTADKLKTLEECHRVLKPGGHMIIADWGRPTSNLMRFCYLGIQMLDGFVTTADNVKGNLPRLMQRGGFERVQEVASYSTMFGTLTILSGVKD